MISLFQIGFPSSSCDLCGFIRTFREAAAVLDIAAIKKTQQLQHLHYGLKRPRGDGREELT